MFKLKTLFSVVFVLILTGCFPSKDLSKKQVHLQGVTMGVVGYNVKYIDMPIEDGEAIPSDVDVHKNIERILKQLNQDMSNWIPDSELSRFNNYDSIQPVEVSDGLRRVIAESIRLGNLSGGKLDVTIGPLINLWGFGPENRPEKVPSVEEIKQAQSRSGIEHLTLNGNMMSKSIPSLYVDLSTIAKGYAVDLVAEYLDSVGAHNYLVEIGGEMRAKGFKQTGELWSVAIERPVSTERAVHQIIIPKDNAVATSGDYRNYFETDGQRYSHIIDPHTGKPINHKLVSVTVIHPSSMTADGLSTAMMLMGPDKAYEFAEKHNLAAYLISKSENGFIEQSTVNFMPYLK